MAPVAAGDEHLGVLAASRSRPPFGQEADELLRAVANQLAVALHKAELIERLTAENIVRDLFEALASGHADVAEARGPRRRLRPRPPPPARSTSSPRGPTATRGRGRRWPSARRRGCAGSRPGALCDAGRESLRALLPLRAGSDDADREELERALASSGRRERVLIGREHDAPRRRARATAACARRRTRRTSRGR